MKACVTGVAGFIGSSIARRLLAQGAAVVGVDSMTNHYARQLKDHNVRSLDGKDFTFVRGDLNDVDLSFLRDVDVIYHQAGQPGVRTSWGPEFATYTRNNVGATQRLLEAASGLPTLRRFIYASSSSVYGTAERFPTLENDVPRPVSPYGVTKLAGEHLVSLYGTTSGVPTVSLRYFTVYGPGQRPDMAFTRFIRAALTGDAISIYGSGEQRRDFTYISDVVDANLLAFASDKVCPGDVVNIAGGSNTSVNEVLSIIADLTGRELNVRRVARAQGDVLRTAGATGRAAQLLGWHSNVTLREGIQRQLAWLRATRELWSTLPANAA